MTDTYILDTGPVGKIAHPRVDPELTKRIRYLLNAGFTIVLPEIADYELRRNILLEIARGNKSFEKSLERLNQLKLVLRYLPLNTDIMLRAAQLWADARHRGQPTADPNALDGDVILAAQAIEIDATILTENVGHLEQFTRVIHWQEVTHL